MNLLSRYAFEKLARAPEPLDPTLAPPDLHAAVAEARRRCDDFDARETCLGVMRAKAECERLMESRVARAWPALESFYAYELSLLGDRLYGFSEEERKLCAAVLGA